MSENEQLIGAIPEWVGQLTNLQVLDMHSTSIEGSIPESVGQLTNLQAWYMSDTNIEGSVNISLATDLIFFSAANTRIQAMVLPPSHASTKLLTLNIENCSGLANYLLDPLPPSLVSLNAENSGLRLASTTFEHASGLIGAQLRGTHWIQCDGGDEVTCIGMFAGCTSLRVLDASNCSITSDDVGFLPPSVVIAVRGS